MSKQFPALLGALRASEWWDHKLIPALAVFYATLWLMGIPVWSRAFDALALLAMIAVAAAFVSVINDLADRSEDQAAGKANRLRGLTRRQIALLLGIFISLGLGFMFLWRGYPLLVLAYGGTWIAFMLYSLRPFRLKARGLAGIAADAAGAHLFPALVAMSLAYAGKRVTPDLWWMAGVATWAFAYGMRGILWHQLLDDENDRRAGSSTFVTRVSPARAGKWGALLVFPLEIAGLAAMLLRLDCALLLVALLAYAALLMQRMRVLGTRAVIVAPAGNWTMVLQEYYEFFLPVSILLISTWFHPIDGLVLCAHLLLFHRRTRAILGQLAAASGLTTPRR